MMYKDVKIIKGPNKGYQGEIRIMGHDMYLVAFEANYYLECVLSKYVRYHNYSMFYTIDNPF